MGSPIVVETMTESETEIWPTYLDLIETEIGTGTGIATVTVIERGTADGTGIVVMIGDGTIIETRFGREGEVGHQAGRASHL